jgi:hypothetical protein
MAMGLPNVHCILIVQALHEARAHTDDVSLGDPPFAQSPIGRCLHVDPAYYVYGHSAHCSQVQLLGNT